MLDLRPNCECCNEDLPPESANARICSFECTFCAACAESFDDICPNCEGEEPDVIECERCGGTGFVRTERESEV